MPLTAEESSDLAAALAPVKMLVKCSFLIVLGMFFIPFLGLLLLLPVGSWLFVLGYRCYHMKRRSIGEGKTCIFIGKYSKRADHNHRSNQAAHIFYMTAGALIMLGTLLSPFF